jgi:hypothetical protein
MKRPKTKRQAVRRIRRRLSKAGLMARAQAVLEAGQSAEFSYRLNAEITGVTGDWVKTDHDARKLVLRILDQMNVDHRLITITLSWEPSVRKLHIFARPAHAVVQEIARGAKLRALGPTEPGPAPKS